MIYFDPSHYATPRDCFAGIKHWYENALTNRTATVGPGTIDTADPVEPLKKFWQVPKDLRLYSPSRQTVIQSRYTGIHGAQVNLNVGVEFDGFRFENLAPWWEQSMSIGFGGDNRADKIARGEPVTDDDIDLNKCTARLSNCWVFGNTHTLYSWRGIGNRIIFEDGHIAGNRFVAGIGSGGAGRCAVMEIYRSKIVGIYQPCTYDPIGGQIGARLHGVYIRGGEMVLRDVEIILTGSGPYTHPGGDDGNGQTFPPKPQPACSNVRAIWMPITGGRAGAEGGNADARCFADRVKITIKSNGSTDWNDIESGCGVIEARACSGSIPIGKLKTFETAPGRVVIRP